MLRSLLLPSACLVLQAAHPWDDAQAAFHRELQPGATGCLVYLERLEAGAIRVRVLAQGTRFGLVEGEPLGHPALAFKVQTPGGAESLWFVTQVPEGAQILRLRLRGGLFNPEVVVALPKPGQSEGTILQAVLGKAEPKAFSKKD